MLSLSRTTSLPAWWDWNVSAQARIASLASAWLLVAFASAPMAIIAPLAVARFGASLLQTIWNQRLDRVQPLGPRAILDWVMMFTAFSASILVSSLDKGGVTLTPTVAFSMVLAPLSVIQVRATLRSFAVYSETSGGLVVTMDGRQREWPASRAA